MEEDVKFLKNAIVGKKVGAIARSSKYVVRSVLNNIRDLDLVNVIEYGPGDGVMTLSLLKILPQNAKFLVVESDPIFVEMLKKIKDSRLIVVHGKMQDAPLILHRYGFDKVDLVLSSIPFSMIDKHEREFVVKDTYEILKPGGKFIVFHQYSTLMTKPLEKFFKKIDTIFEPRNVFPCFIISSTK